MDRERHPPQRPTGRAAMTRHPWPHPGRAAAGPGKASVTA
jgi:hypothetical protein